VPEKKQFRFRVVDSQPHINQIEEQSKPGVHESEKHRRSKCYRSGDPTPSSLPADQDAVGTALTGGPPLGPERAGLPHSVLALDVERQTEFQGRDGRASLLCLHVGQGHPFEKERTATHPSVGVAT